MILRAFGRSQPGRDTGSPPQLPLFVPWGGADIPPAPAEIVTDGNREGACLRSERYGTLLKRRRRVSHSTEELSKQCRHLLRFFLWAASAQQAQLIQRGSEGCHRAPCVIRGSICRRTMLSVSQQIGSDGQTKHGRDPSSEVPGSVGKPEVKRRQSLRHGQRCSNLPMTVDWVAYSNGSEKCCSRTYVVNGSLEARVHPKTSLTRGAGSAGARCHRHQGRKNLGAGRGWLQ